MRCARNRSWRRRWCTSTLLPIFSCDLLRGLQVGSVVTITTGSRSTAYKRNTLDQMKLVPVSRRCYGLASHSTSTASELPWRPISRIVLRLWRTNWYSWKNACPHNCGPKRRSILASKPDAAKCLDTYQSRRSTNTAIVRGGIVKVPVWGVKVAVFTTGSAPFVCMG